jgi:cyclopropane-fatty-acyl-phospholipid synthase
MSDSQSTNTYNAGLAEEAIERAGRMILPGTVVGSLTITFPSGRTAKLGTPGAEPHAQINLKNYRAIRNAFSRASIGFAESYMAGDVDLPDITNVIQFFIQNRAKFMAQRYVRSLFKVRIQDKLWHRTRRNSPMRSKDNIEAHYDLGNAFYEIWLDESMTYSSALFEDDSECLAQAQVEKYKAVANALNIKPGTHLLEIGCGWGGFAEYVTKTHDARLTGITLSQEQIGFARQRVSNNSARFQLLDYRHAEGQYDGIASIEMIEAVGEEHWQDYFQIIYDRLKPGASAAIQAITIDEAHYETYRHKVDFIQRYIFPGGMLPSKSVLASYAEKSGLEMEAVKTFGDSYARTLNLWSKNFDKNWEHIEMLGFDTRFQRMWRYYLAYCEAGFLEGVLDVGIYRYTRKS